jgi:serine/threonine protein kinase
MFDDNWNIKLIDFGLSCQNDSDELRNTYCGTASYNPPEIVQQMPYESELVDVWCLGVTLYAMVTCEFPFAGKN